MEDIEIGLHCMESGMGWYRKIQLIKEAVANIERGYKVITKTSYDVTTRQHIKIVKEEKEPIDEEFELKNIKLMLFGMVQELGVLTTCGLKSTIALSRRETVINAVDDLAKKDFVALNTRLKILEELAP